MAAMPDPSPATRAILRAFNDRYELCGPFDDNWQELCLAAAIRALADHEVEAWDGGPLCHWIPDYRIRKELRGTAAELESADQSTKSTH